MYNNCNQGKYKRIRDEGNAHSNDYSNLMEQNTEEGSRINC